MKMACSQFAGGVKLGWRWYAEVVWNQFAGGVESGSRWCTVRLKVACSVVGVVMQSGWKCSGVWLEVV